MTREEAIQFLGNLKHKEEAGRAMSDGFYAELMGYHVEALNMAIKALEQEDEIEKIRAEVKNINLWALRYAPTYDEDIRPQIVSNVKEHVLEIIDKYRAESEE